MGRLRRGRSGGVRRGRSPGGGCPADSRCVCDNGLDGSGVVSRMARGSAPSVPSLLSWRATGSSIRFVRSSSIQRRVERAADEGIGPNGLRIMGHDLAVSSCDIYMNRGILRREVSERVGEPGSWAPTAHSPLSRPGSRFGVCVPDHKAHAPRVYVAAWVIHCRRGFRSATGIAFSFRGWVGRDGCLGRRQHVVRMTWIGDRC